MNKILLVTESAKGKETLVKMLSLDNSATLLTVKTAAEARLFSTEQIFDMVIIVAPLIDEDGRELSLFVAESGTASVILITPAEQVKEMQSLVERYGVLVLGKPIDKRSLLTAVHAISVYRHRLLFLDRRNQELNKKNTELQEKIEEIKLINRAKQVLIKNLNITEPQAHRYIEKQAMDLRVTKSQIAQNLLKTYDKM